MRFLAIQLTSLLLLLPLSTSLSCTKANWWHSLDGPGWSVCPRTNTYIKGFYRSAPPLLDLLGTGNGVFLLEEANCCEAGQGYTNQLASCRHVDWTVTLDSKYVWAKCTTGYYLNGIRISNKYYLHQIEEAKCCRPHNHPDAYQDCYEEDVTYSFDKEGWSECKRPDYYMAGFYRSDCDKIYCIEKFWCCKMKNGPVNGGWSVFGDWGQCSSSCGAGVKERMRTCTNPPPAYGGAQCSGPNKETQQCNSAPCPVDGGFSAWSTFGECSKTCGRGWKHRTRECTNPPPSGHGKNCKGKYKQAAKCKVRSCKGL